MKFNSKKVRDIIYPDEDFVDIIGIDKRGRFIYEFGFWADIIGAIKNNSYVVKVSAYATNPIVSVSMFEDAKNSREVIDSLKNYDSKLKTTVRSARANPLASRSVDISANINNSVAKKIKQDPKNASNYIESKRQILAIPMSNMSGEFADELPNLNVSKVESPANQDRSVRRAAIKSIMAGIDPSAIGEASFPLNNHWSSLQGIDGKFSDPRSQTFQVLRTPKEDLEWQYENKRELTQSQYNNSVKNNSWSKYLRTSFRTGDNSTSSLSTAPAKTIVVSKLVSNAQTHLKGRVYIPKKSISGIKDIHFLIELQDSKGDIIDVKHKIVNHAAEIEEFLTPDYAPKIRARSIGIGRNVILIKQVDKVATEVWLYRKILSPASPFISTDYQLIKKISLTKSDSYFRVVDQINNSKTCIYRAVAVGPNNRVSSSFRNSIAEPHRKISINKKTVTELTHISIFAQTQDDRVMVRVTNIPEGPIAIYVTAVDLSNKPELRRFNDTVRIVGALPEEQTKVIGSDTRELVFNDNAVQHGHVYEYRAVMIYPNGSEVKSHVTEVHEFLKQMSDEAKIVIDITGLAIQADDGGNSIVTFNIESSFTDRGAETVVSSLVSAGADKSFISEIQENRDKLNNLLAFLVQRQDSGTGETETFGVTSDPTFVDDMSTRRAAGVSPIRSGSRYRYIVKVLLRSAESFFESTITETVDLETVKRFNKKIAKFMNPSTLMNGTLPTTGQSLAINFISRLNHEDKFLQGRTGVESGVDVEIPKVVPFVNSVNVQRANNSKNLIFWTISGNPSEIDHFIVMAEIHGIRSTVATVHNETNSGKYFYYDREVASEVGTVKYSIIPVLSDYTYGVEVHAKEITLMSHMPNFVSES